MSEAIEGLSFSIDSGLSPLNKIASFPEEMRPKVIEGLRGALDLLPTGDEYYAARRNGPSGERRMEKMYGAAADAFAQIIDPQHDPDKGVAGNSAETTEARGKFYQMIRTLVKEQISKGLSKLEKRG